MGMKTFDQSLFELYQAGEISYEDALRYADPPTKCACASSWRRAAMPGPCRRAWTAWRSPRRAEPRLRPSWTRKPGLVRAFSSLLM